MIIAIDFDGTCVTHEYPKVGDDIGAQEVLKELISNGHKLILWTMRSDKIGETTLKDALDWFHTKQISLWGINQNPDQISSGWSKSNKQYANLYIDDAALGCPLIYNEDSKPFVDWIKVREMLVEQKFIKDANQLQKIPS